MKAVSADLRSSGTVMVRPGLWTRLLASAMDRAVPGLALVASLAGLVLGWLCLGFNTLEAYPVPALALMALSTLVLLYRVHRVEGYIDRKLLVLAVLSVLAAILIRILPEYMYGFHINGLIHRSLVSAILLFAVSLPASCYSLRYLLGSTPSSADAAVYPLLLVPVVIALTGYSLLIWRLVADGLPQLDWHIISTPYVNQFQGAELVQQAGMRNHILGTLELMALTSLISAPVGIRTGLFLAQYPGRVVAAVVRFSTTALRSVSVLILGLTAYSLVTYSQGTAISTVFAGYYYDIAGNRHPANGSFLTAALLLSLLVIPMIARATETGFRSVPERMRDASAALGASEGYELTHLVFPWALPNIVTALLLGCAEAAGSVAILMFIARTGEYGHGPLGEVTSLSYLIFDSQYGLPQLTNLMRPYQFSAALALLLIISCLTVPALALKWRFGERYRGA